MRRWWQWVVWGAILAAPLAAGLFRVWVHQDAVLLGYQLSTETKRRAALRESVRKLEVEWAAARSPERLMELARRHGLRLPEPSQRVVGSDR